VTVEVNELKNITISLHGNEICEQLKTDGYFNSALEAYRAAICLAIAQELELDEDTKGTLNKWDTASVFRDPDSNIESILLLKGYSPEDVVVKGKLLAEAGLRYIESKRLLNVDILSVLIGQ
jgi:hypothetical protein